MLASVDGSLGCLQSGPLHEKIRFALVDIKTSIGQMVDQRKVEKESWALK